MRLFALFLAAVVTVPAAIAQNSFPALLATGPSDNNRDKLQLFGQFVGTWTFDGTEYHDDGSHPKDKGEIQFHWVLNGSALQDVFLESSRSDNGALLDGTSIRFYDPKIDAWRITWINPQAGVVRTFIGRKSGGDIVMEGSQSDGTPIRWIFSKIESNTFHWHGEKRVGTKWCTYEELDARRK
jgi:hypothetical protein